MGKVWRLWRIIYIFSKHRLDHLIPLHHLPLWARVILWFAPWNLKPAAKHQSRGKRLRLALESLGPIFVKFGQILSTRPDLIPHDIAQELKALQDNVEPFAGSAAIALIERQLGGSIQTLFAEFDPRPLASASIAQVHAAKLSANDPDAPGQQVVVKVVRPNIERTIEGDLRLMEMMAYLLARYLPDGRRLKPVQVVEEFRHTIYGELDLKIEASNATQLRRNFKDSELVYIPEVYWAYCRSKVMVSERIYGIPVADVEALRAQNTNFKELAERGVELFFTQVFRDRFFHADMHPGNIFVSRNNPQKPQYIAIDCGIVGTLDEQDQHYLAMNLMAFFNQDYQQVAQLHVDSGWVPSATKTAELAAAIRSVCEPIFEKPLAEISFGQVLLQLFSTARRFQMEVQPQLVLLQKTLMNIEGLGRQLYPELDLWKTAKPYLERWLKDRYGAKNAWRELKRQLPLWLDKAPDIPNLIHASLDSFSTQKEQSIQLQQEIQALKDQLVRNHKQQKRQSVALVLLILSGIAIWQAPNLDAHTLLAAGLASLSFIWLWFK